MSFNKGKWIGNNEINGDKVRLQNEQFIRGRNALDTADVNIVKVNSDNKAEFGTEPISNFSPSTPQSLTTKQFVLDLIAGVRDPKDAVRLATVGNLAAYTPAGSGIGKTLTADANGALTVDGIAAELNDRIAVLNEGVHNGIYIVTQIGDAGNPWILTRSTDADEDLEVTQGLSFDVVEGTVLGKTRWLLTTKNITVDTTALVFVKIPTGSSLVDFKTEKFTISALDLSNEYIDLANEAETGSIMIYPVGGPVQEPAVDYSSSVVSNVTRITFLSTFLATLEENDIVVVKYTHYVG